MPPPCIDFPGVALSIKTPIFKADFNTNKMLIVVEVKSLEDDFWMFSDSNLQIPLRFKSKCAHCTRSAELTFHCRCNEQSYCTLFCKSEDEKFHLRKCPAKA